MCDIKTGDDVLVDTDYCPEEPRVYLYTRKDGKHVCQKKANWEISGSGTSSYKHIKPAPKYETRVLGPVAMMQALIDEGYTVDDKGNWYREDDSVSFQSAMWKFCGEEKPHYNFTWRDSWLEKVEV